MQDLEAGFGMSVYNLSEIWQESSAEYTARMWHDTAGDLVTGNFGRHSVKGNG